MSVVSNGIKTAVILRDSDPLHPRQDWDNVGKMICWHSRYNLGDKHSYSNPESFAQDLCSEYVSDKAFYQAIQAGKFELLRLAENKDGYSIQVKNLYTTDPNSWDADSYEAYTLTKDLDMPDADNQLVREDLMSYCSPSELFALCSECDNLAILPLYLFDHSGLAMNTGGFNDPWDSGQVGFIYMDQKTAQDELSVPGEDWKSRALDCLKAEVKAYDNYLRGDVYGYQAYEGLEEVDSCWSFYPGDGMLIDLFDDMFGSWGAELKDLMRHAGYGAEDEFDIEDYFSNHDFPELREKVLAAVRDYITYESETSQIYPFGMSAEELLANKDGVLDTIVEELYEDHRNPETDRIHEAIETHAGLSRDLKPKLRVADLDPNRDYTADELLSLLQEKKALDTLIADAQSRKPHESKPAERSNGREFH